MVLNASLSSRESMMTVLSPVGSGLLPVLSVAWGTGLDSIGIAGTSRTMTGDVGF